MANTSMRRTGLCKWFGNRGYIYLKCTIPRLVPVSYIMFNFVYMQSQHVTWQMYSVRDLLG